MKVWAKTKKKMNVIKVKEIFLLHSPCFTRILQKDEFFSFAIFKERKLSQGHFSHGSTVAKCFFLFEFLPIRIVESK